MLARRGGCRIALLGLKSSVRSQRSETFIHTPPCQVLSPPGRQVYGILQLLARPQGHRVGGAGNRVFSCATTLALACLPAAAATCDNFAQSHMDTVHRHIPSQGACWACVALANSKGCCTLTTLSVPARHGPAGHKNALSVCAVVLNSLPQSFMRVRGSREPG